MTPQQKLKHLIIVTYYRHGGDVLDAVISEHTIDEIYKELDRGCLLQDAKNEVRCSAIGTEIEQGYSQHYKFDSVAEQMPCGTWVGWRYWYGGDDYGEPESIEWIADAYDLDVTEKKVIQIVREFKKK